MLTKLRSTMVTFSILAILCLVANGQNIRHSGIVGYSPIKWETSNGKSVNGLTIIIRLVRKNETISFVQGHVRALQGEYLRVKGKPPYPLDRVIELDNYTIVSGNESNSGGLLYKSDLYYMIPKAFPVSIREGSGSLFVSFKIFSEHLNLLSAKKTSEIPVFSISIPTYTLESNGKEFEKSGDIILTDLIITKSEKGSYVLGHKQNHDTWVLDPWEIIEDQKLEQDVGGNE